MTSNILTWFTTASTWTMRGGILDRLAEHLQYSLLVVVIAAAIGIPLGLAIGHTGRGRWIVLAANTARAVPTLGLLFALALWLGPHLRGDSAFLLPSVVALVLLAVPPILAGAYAGVEAVDSATRDAAWAMGMSRIRVLRSVEVPCALPLVISGLRAAFLQVIATATIAAFVGLGGLGRFLTDGLASADYGQTAGGALLVAALALVADGVLALLGRYVISPGLRESPATPTERTRQ